MDKGLGERIVRFGLKEVSIVATALRALFETYPRPVFFCC